MGAKEKVALPKLDVDRSATCPTRTVQRSNVHSQTPREKIKTAHAQFGSLALIDSSKLLLFNNLWPMHWVCHAWQP
jgi:hypothetical protein